jgi:phosphoribosylanthranilate isomerase
MGQIRIQIYTMQSVAEAQAVAALGVDHIGVAPAHHGLPGEVDEPLAAEICRAVDGTAATSVALSVDTDVDTITSMAQTVRPDILHLCGPPGAVGPEDVAGLRRKLPNIAVMQAIAVTGPEALDAARLYESVADYLILDSVSPDIAGVGAAGAIHDWEVSAAITATTDVPVILAGGLSPDNVREAIATVQPWGVDSLTHTNEPTGSGGFRKDLDAIRRLVSAARVPA